MHRAPVVGLVVLDGKGSPLPEPLEVAHDLARSPEMHGSHHLLVVSEEQFKVRNLHHTTSFSPIGNIDCVLPFLCVHSCLPCLKWAVSRSWSWQRLTALVWGEWAWLGSALGPMNSWRAVWWYWPIRVSYMSSLCPPSKCWSTILAYEEKTWVESRLVFSPNMAKVGNARLYMHRVFIDLCKSMKLLWNCLFGHLLGFYLISPSEFERFSLSTRWVVEPRCLVEAPLQMRSKTPSSPVHRDQPDGVTTENRCM